MALHKEWRQVEVFQLKQALHRAGLHEVAVEVEVGVELGGLHDVGNATVGAQVDESGHLYLELVDGDVGHAAAGVDLRLEGAEAGEGAKQLACRRHERGDVALSDAEDAFQGEGGLGLHGHRTHGHIGVGLEA